MTMDNTFIMFHSGAPPEPRDKVPSGEVVVRPARRQYDGEDVALIRNAEWVADYRDDVIPRRRHCPLVRVEDAVDVAQYLREHEDQVFVARELFERGEEED
jgi:hypothetical protein